MSSNGKVSDNGESRAVIESAVVGVGDAATRSGGRRRAVAGMVTLIGGSGVLHFLAPKPYDSLIPKALPGKPRTWTYLSGVAELGCAAALAIPRTRRLGGLLTALLLVAVFPANVQMAVAYQQQGKPLPMRLVAYGRLPLQWPLIRWALRIRQMAQ